MTNDKIIDLHVHSSNSDGTFMSTQLIQMANHNHVGILAIADHDCIDGIEEFQHNIPVDMLGVKGIEFSSFVLDHNERIRIHILGYGFDEENDLFQSLLKEMKEKRIQAHLKLLKELKEKIKMFPSEEIEKLNITKYCWFDREVFSYLEKEKYSNIIIEELRNYYKTYKFSYGQDYDLDARRVIDAIHSAGGYVVFAHPMAYRFSSDRDQVERIIYKLIKLGIDGIEIYQSDCSTEDTIWLREIVNKKNLLYSVGSDFHRIINSDGRQIGLGINKNLCIPDTTLSDEIMKTKKYFKKVNG